jgi:predicted RNase H-like nuclease (RuvC/YqgF family)
MALPLIPIAIGLGITTAASLTSNIIQGIQNGRLRKQIEMLLAIIENIKSDIEETRKELKALKIWSFKQKYKLHKKISKLKKRIKEKTLEIYYLKQQINKVV